MVVVFVRALPRVVQVKAGRGEGRRRRGKKKKEKGDDDNNDNRETGDDVDADVVWAIANCDTAVYPTGRYKFTNWVQPL